MSQSEICKDLTKHFATRLQQVMADYRDRCQEAGVPEDEMLASLGSTLLGGAARFLSLMTFMTPQDAGKQMERLVSKSRDSEVPDSIKELMQKARAEVNFDA